MLLSQMMEYQTGLQSKDPLYSDTLFIDQVVYQKQNTERSCLQIFIVHKRYRIWCVCSWPIAVFISALKKIILGTSASEQELVEWKRMIKTTQFYRASR